MKKPTILLHFDERNSVEWKSVGWGGDASLRAKAKEALNKGEHPEEVMKLLREAGFTVRTY